MSAISRLDKEYQDTPQEKLPELPVAAISGISESDADLLYKAFYIKTIRDLAELKYVIWAKELKAEAEKATKDLSDYSDKLIKEFETKTAKQVIKAPIYALEGVSKADATKLEKAFRIKTVQAFANLKYAQYAREITEESDEAAAKASAVSAPAQEPETRPVTSSNANKPEKNNMGKMLIWAFIILLILLLLLIFGPKIKQMFSGEPEKTANEQTKKEPILTSGNETDENANETTVTEPTEPESGEATQGEDNKEPVIAENGNKPEGSENVTPTEKDNNTSGNTTQGETYDYRVKWGDSLADIAYRELGAYNKWQRIYEANRDRIKNPNNIISGQVIKIPK